MKNFSERSPKRVALGTAVALLAVAAVTFSANRLPVLSSPHDTYHAQLANADQLAAGDMVTVAGVKVGAVTGLHLDGSSVRLDFEVNPGVHLGRSTTLAVETLSLLGQEYVQLAPQGPGHMAPGSTIPLARTTVTRTLLNSVTQLGSETGHIDEAQLQRALAVADQAASSVSPGALSAVVAGVGQLSTIVTDNQDQLAKLVQATDQVAGTLSGNDAQLVQLVDQSRTVLGVVRQRQTAIDQLLAATQALSTELSTIITSKHADLAALLANLRSVSANLAHESSTLASTLPLLSAFSTFTANAAGNGPFVDVVAPTILLSDGVTAACGAQGGPNPLTGCNLP
ncbi:MAG: MCE family protein [Actinomycetota bacterium]|jgi:phospholipid/cholesterol/gamma-HCH transport system substrate-binding protein|nr:MCE family protein [Actinomycetota bacterium]